MKGRKALRRHITFCGEICGKKTRHLRILEQAPGVEPGCPVYLTGAILYLYATPASVFFQKTFLVKRILDKQFLMLVLIPRFRSSLHQESDWSYSVLFFPL